MTKRDLYQKFKAGATYKIDQCNNIPCYYNKEKKGCGKRF